MPYDPDWLLAFEREAVSLRQALGTVAIRIDHIGSTSVPGLAAKPIVDIQVSVRSIELVESYRGPLASLGYLFVPDPERPPYHFFGKPAARPRTYHVHVCDAGGLHEVRHLAVRDFLRAHPAEAAAYAQVKRAAAIKHPSDRLAYMASKGPFVEDLQQRALAWLRSVQNGAAAQPSCYTRLSPRPPDR